MKDLNLSPLELVGFFVGEGSFSVESGQDSKYLSGWRIRPFVSIAIRKDDEEILYAIKNIIGCGQVYELDFGRYLNYQNKGWKPQVKWKASNISELFLKVVPFFDEHRPFGTKGKAYEVFRKLVQMKFEQEDRNASGLEKMKALAKELQLINKRGI